MWRLAAFMSGLVALWIPVGSPLEALDHALLTIHMVQHILLMVVAAPLLLLGAPVLAFVHALPQRLVRAILVRILRRAPIASLGHLLIHPVFGWLAAMLVLIGWHVPVIFKLGLTSNLWHEIEQASFFFTGLLFWWPVVEPWPPVSKWPRWRTPLYLFLATLPCDALSAFLAFCGRVVYSPYLAAPQHFGISPLQDQECAGALMWVFATFVYLVPAVVVTMQLLSPPRTHPVEQTQADLSRMNTQSRPVEAEVA
jgi:putative membrane protein